MKGVFHLRSIPGTVPLSCGRANEALLKASPGCFFKRESPSRRYSIPFTQTLSLEYTPGHPCFYRVLCSYLLMDFDKTKGYPGEGPSDLELCIPSTKYIGDSAVLPFETFMACFILYRRFYLEISPSLEALFTSLVRFAEAKEAF